MVLASTFFLEYLIIQEIKHIHTSIYMAWLNFLAENGGTICGFKAEQRKIRITSRFLTNASLTMQHININL